MRVTYRDFRRRFVYNWKVGTQQVKRVMRNGVQIWPGGEERIRRIGLDMSEVEGAIDGLYWQHAINAVATGSSFDCLIQTRVAGRYYNVGSTYGSTPLVMYEMGALVFGENDGPAAGDVRVGDVLKFLARVPERRPFADAAPGGNDGGSVLRWGLPWLEGSYVEGLIVKGKKKVSPHLFFKVWSEVNEAQWVHAEGTVMCHGHGRGTWEWKAFPAGVSDVKQGTLVKADDREHIGQRSVCGQFWSDNWSTGSMRMVFPAFYRVFNIPVISVEV